MEAARRWLAEARAAALLPALPAVLGRSRVVVMEVEWERVLAAIPGALAGQDAETPPDRLAALLPWAAASDSATPWCRSSRACASCSCS